MRPAERQREIATQVMAEGSASASELAERFQVSLMTIHRDLDELERVGLVRKFRGGVTAQPSSVFESNVTFRRSVAVAEKAAIARHAAGLVEPGMAVMFDDSTSALAVAEQLERVTPLTVVTNFLEIVRLFAGRQDVRLICLGGEYNSMHDSFLGVPCVDAVRLLRADLLFASVSTVDEGHVFHQEQDIVLVKQAMLQASGRRVLLVDHGKLGRTALHRLAPVTDFDLVVTDDGADPASVDALREWGVPVEVAVSRDR